MQNKIIIQATDLVLGYKKNHLTKPFNLNVFENEWIGIVGKNGCGKSTFLKTILGLRKTVSGTITINNESKKNKNLISYIPQEREINTTTYTNGYSIIKSCYNCHKLGIPFFNAEFYTYLDYLIDLVGANDFIKKPFQNLSGGQKKRIYLAQALINKPKLLLLDEPLSDLDPLAKQGFINVLKQVHKFHSLTLLIISHDMQEISQDLDNFIHFKDSAVHFCQKIPCLLGEKNVFF